MDLHDQRTDYSRNKLSEADIQPEPFAQFKTWYEVAKQSAIREANAMVLATATAAAKPSARVVLLKEVSDRGFIFHTNYHSRKGKEIHENPQAQLLFYWDILERQVRIEGTLEKVAPEVSDAYFLSRPAEGQYSAMISDQSQVIPSRDYLEQRIAAIRNTSPKRPENWGGYILIPDYFEFWQGRPSRLHDRIFYKKDGASWKTGRLAP